MLSYQPLNLNSLTEKTAAKLTKYFQTNPLQVAPICPHTLGFYGVDPERSPEFFITFGELLDTKANEPYDQESVKPERVAGLLVGGSASYPHPLAETRRFLEPINLSVLESGLEFPSSGRHRITALATAYSLSGYDLNSPEIQEMLIPVVRKEYYPESVVVANKTRPTTKQEQSQIKAQIKGVDLDDIESIMTALAEGRFKPEETFRHAAILARQEAEQVPELVKGLTNATLGDIYASFVSQYFKLVPSAKPGKTMLEWLTKLMARALTSKDGKSFVYLDRAIVAASKAYGSKNYAYIATKIAYQLVLQVKVDMDTPVKVTKTEKEMLATLEARKEAVQKSAKPTKTSKSPAAARKTKKDKPTREPQQAASLEVSEELCPA